MRSIDRRLFLSTTAGLTTAIGGTSQLQKISAAEISPPPLVPLGKTGVKVSRLAQGTGVQGWNRQSNQTRLGFKKLVNLFHHAYDRGIRFFDLADLYGTHVYFREALKSLPREEVAILTKIWWRYDGPEKQSNSQWRKQAATTTLDRFMHELETDYLDVVLLHCMQKQSWDRELLPYMEALDQAKTKGTVRAVGVSCHDFGALQTAAESPWVDVILARINPKGVKMDGTQEEILGVLKKAQKNGKAVIGMKIFGEGKLVSQREKCIQFAQSIGVLDSMTIGFETTEQIDDVVRLMRKYPANLPA